MADYTLLYAANKNAGDYLIYERAKALLRHHKGMGSFDEYHSLSTPLDGHADAINATRALVICGGPGLQANLYPGRYPLASNLSRIKVPIVLLGLGWSGEPGDDVSLAGYRFTASTMQLFDRIKSDGIRIGVRDYLSLNALKRNGIHHADMVGCPVWYDLDCLGDELRVPENIGSVGFSPPASVVFGEQAEAVLARLARIFPRARKVCAFHGGLTADFYISKVRERAYRRLKAVAEEKGFSVIDVSGGADKMQIYDSVDLHVGYRVHAHIYCLSRRRPSILLNEDGRGRGATEAIGIPGVDAWEYTEAGYAVARSRVPKLRGAVRRTLGEMRACPYAAQNMEELVQEELESGFARFLGVPARLERQHRAMKNFLEQIP